LDRSEDFGLANIENELSTILDILHSPFSWKISILDLSIGIGIAALIPIIYVYIQKNRKKQNVKNFWKTRKETAEQLVAATPINLLNIELSDLIFELGKIELSGSDSCNELDYIAYANKIRSLNQLLNTKAQPQFILQRLKIELENLVASY